MTKTLSKSRIAELEQAHADTLAQLASARDAICIHMSHRNARDLLLRYANEMCAGAPCVDVVSQYRERANGAVDMLREQGFITEKAWCEIRNVLMFTASAARDEVTVRIGN